MHRSVALDAGATTGGVLVLGEYGLQLREPRGCCRHSTDCLLRESCRLVEGNSASVSEARVESRCDTVSSAYPSAHPLVDPYELLDCSFADKEFVETTSSVVVSDSDSEDEDEARNEKAEAATRAAEKMDDSVYESSGSEDAAAAKQSGAARARAGEEDDVCSTCADSDSMADVAGSTYQDAGCYGSDDAGDDGDSGSTEPASVEECLASLEIWGRTGLEVTDESKIILSFEEWKQVRRCEGVCGGGCEGGCEVEEDDLEEYKEEDGNEGEEDGGSVHVMYYT